MKKSIIKSLILLTFPFSIFSQTWTEISSNFDSLWTNSVHYYNKGDTIIHYGSTTGTGAFDAKRFYISIDGGYTFERDVTNLDIIGTDAFYGLRQNNMFIGFKNTPNMGSYLFEGIDNWSLFMNQLNGVWGEINEGTIFCNQFVFTLPMTGTPSGNISGLPLNLRTTFNKGNRVFLGGRGVKYYDDGNYTSLSESVFSPALTVTETVMRFFEGQNNELYAVTNTGFDNLYKSTDNGQNWTLQTTTYDNGGNPGNLNSNFIIGTPNGNIFFLKNGNSDDVFLSQDGGVNAVKISDGLPVDAVDITATSKLLTNGIKVWYQVRAANTTDFVRTDTEKAGLYLFQEETSSLKDNKIEDLVIFPNPCVDKIQISNLNQGDENQIRIYSASGELIFTINTLNSQVDLNLNQLENGIYFLEVLNSKNKWSKKVVLNK
jgi:hypothetical protein